MAATAAPLDTLTGRRGVDIGTSFTRAWNERIGKPTKRSKDYPNPEYYSLRYNFKPESIDNEGTGTLTPKKGGDGHSFELERPSQQGGGSHRYTAVEQPSKEWECVLLWDPATQQLTLEKLESNLNLTYEGRGKGSKQASTPSPLSPPPAPATSRAKRPPAGSSNNTAREMDYRELEEELNKVLPDDFDAEGEPDDDLEAEIEALVNATPRQEEEEEEEEEEEDMEPVELPPPPPPPVVKPRAPPKAPPKAKTKPRARKEIIDGIEEEELNFGEPTKRTRRRTTNNSAAASSTSTSTSNIANSGLALPTLPPQNPHAPPTPSQLLQPPPVTRITYAGSDSGSDTDSSDNELDAAALELEMEMERSDQQESEQQEQEQLVIPPTEQHPSGRPWSLNEFLEPDRQLDIEDTSSDSE